MKYWAWFLIFTSFTLNLAFAQDRVVFSYDEKGKRDPFHPLVDKDGRYLVEIELPFSSDVLNLSGILWDPQGKSSALINNQVVRVGDSIGGFAVKDISKDSVIISKDGKKFILKISKEEE
jgi:type II secretory pathway component PulC